MVLARKLLGLSNDAIWNVKADRLSHRETKELRTGYQLKPKNRLRIRISAKVL